MCWEECASLGREQRAPAIDTVGFRQRTSHAIQDGLIVQQHVTSCRRKLKTGSDTIACSLRVWVQYSTKQKLQLALGAAVTHLSYPNTLQKSIPVRLILAACYHNIVRHCLHTALWTFAELRARAFQADGDQEAEGIQTCRCTHGTRPLVNFGSSYALQAIKNHNGEAIGRP